MPVTNKKQLKGSWAHQAALLWLLDRGYYVFSNVFGYGPIDVVAINDLGDIELFDVKVAGFRNNKDTKGSKQLINRILTEEQKDMGVKLLYVFDDGSCRVQMERGEWLKKQKQKRDEKGRYIGNGIDSGE